MLHIYLQLIFSSATCGAENSNRFAIEKLFGFKNSSIQYIYPLDILWHQYKKNQNLPGGHAVFVRPCRPNKMSAIVCVGLRLNVLSYKNT
jgi:hypothetical protein